MRLPLRLRKKCATSTSLKFFCHQYSFWENDGSCHLLNKDVSFLWAKGFSLTKYKGPTKLQLCQKIILTTDTWFTVQKILKHNIGPITKETPRQISLTLVITKLAKISFQTDCHVSKTLLNTIGWTMKKKIFNWFVKIYF